MEKSSEDVQVGLSRTAKVAESAPTYAEGSGRIDPERKSSLECELKRILPILIEKYDPEKIIVFGSMVTGKVHSASDLDLAIIKKTDKRFLDRILDVDLLARPWIAVDFFVYTPEEFEAKLAEKEFFFVDEIVGGGKTLYERN